MLSCNKSKEKYSKIKTTKVEKVANIHKIVLDDFKNANGYTYIKVTESGKTYWMAISKIPVKIGETYYYNGGMIMKDFKSEELNKTFDTIIFIDKIRSTRKVQPKIIGNNPHTKAIKKDTLAEIIKITQPKNGTSIENLLAKKEAFSEKTITIKGKVIKVNNGIMKKNWVHIADGTKFEDKKDLGITTLDTVKVGDIVTFKGKIVLNKDFGYGYVYPVLLEDATLVK